MPFYSEHIEIKLSKKFHQNVAVKSACFMLFGKNCDFSKFSLEIKTIIDNYQNMFLMLVG